MGRVLPFKKRGTALMHRDHAEGQGTDCVLVMYAGVAHSAGLRGAGQVCLNANIGTFPPFEGEELGVAGEGK